MKALCNFENDLKYAFCKRTILINLIFLTSKTIVVNLSWYDYTIGPASVFCTCFTLLGFDLGVV